jgi:hypothetical protein
MTTEAQRQASRENGAQSHGPVTPEGKARSSLNNHKDGFYAKKLTLMPDDDPAFWESILDDHDQSFEPEDHIEAQIVRKLAEGVFLIERWDRRRAAVELRAYNGPGKHYGLGIGLADNPDCTPAYENYGRWIERQSRANDRLHRQFLRHRKARRSGSLSGEATPVPANDDRHDQNERFEPGLILKLLTLLLALDAEGADAQRAWVQALPAAERQGLRGALVDAGRRDDCAAEVDRACLMWNAMEEAQRANLNRLKRCESR